MQILSRFVEYRVLVLDRDGFCPPKGINLRMFERTKLFAVKLCLSGSYLICIIADRRSSAEKRTLFVLNEVVKLECFAKLYIHPL